MNLFFCQKKIILAVLSVSLATACIGARAESLVTQWNDVTLEAIRAVRPGPVVVSRSLALVNTAMFDAWAAYDERAVGTRLGDALRQPADERTDVNKQAAMSFAAYMTLVDIFPAEIERFKMKMVSLGYSLTQAVRQLEGELPINIENAMTVGIRAEQALMEYRHKDGSNQLGDLKPGSPPYSDYTGYIPTNNAYQLSDPNRWQPLIVPGQVGCHDNDPIQTWCMPHWGKVKPFALRSGSQFRPHAPAKVHQWLYKKQAEMVVNLTANLNDKNKVIAEYWADGPTSELPPGHWVLLAKVVSNRDKNTIDQDVKMYFALTNAMFDAGIAAWDTKRAYDSIRPISAIRYLFKGKTLPHYDGQTIQGENWVPYQPARVVTPPFAEYVSGHSAFSAAAATVLMRFTKSDRFGHSETIPAGQSRVQPGVVPANPVTLTWPTFSSAADQAGRSRQYGGIHFAMGDYVGRDLGRVVGAYVWQRAERYWQPPLNISND
jgi:PAP2 superfamily